MKPREYPFNILTMEDQFADFHFVESMLRSSSLDVEQKYKACLVSEDQALQKPNTIGLIPFKLSPPDSFEINSFLKIRDFTLLILVMANAVPFQNAV